MNERTNEQAIYRETPGTSLGCDRLPVVGELVCCAHRPMVANNRNLLRPSSGSVISDHIRPILRPAGRQLCILKAVAEVLPATGRLGARYLAKSRGGKRFP